MLNFQVMASKIFSLVFYTYRKLIVATLNILGTQIVKYSVILCDNNCDFLNQIRFLPQAGTESQVTEHR